MKFGVADYGMNVWYGGLFDIEQRLEDLKAIGYQGTERLEAPSASDALCRAARYRMLGMDFATVRASDVQTGIQWTAALGKDYVWTSVRADNLDVFCRQVNAQSRACARWGIKVGLHNHLGSLVESQEELEKFLAACPEAGLILDTAHLAAADGDCVEIAKRYADRVVAVHLKDWILTSSEIGLEQWSSRGRFCELGAGNIGLDNLAVMNALVKEGYDGWVLVEQDTHLRDPLADLKVSREYLRQGGF